ncbi:hypothetical protein V8C40DRAFT_236143 [Trichoderma camerunense]
MPVAQQNERPQVPEHIQSHLDEIHKTAEAAEAAIKAGNTELATELKAQLKHLFENAPEDAKTGGFIGSGGNNIPVPPKDDTEDLPESQRQINAELKELAAALHKAIQDEDHETAKELRAQISALRQKSQQESKITSKAAGFFQIWVEIHNLDSSRLFNDGGWNVAHGWFESDRVADSLGYGDVAYIHMGGAPGPGIYCTAYYSYRDGAAYSGSFTWTVDYDYRGYSDGRWDSWHSWDGRILRFYVQQR